MSRLRRTFTACFLALALVLLPQLTLPAAAYYLIDAGDSLLIQVRGAEIYNFAGIVRPDGIVAMPFLGDVDVKGQTADQVRERVRTLVAKVVRDPLVNVAITGYRPRIVTVLGEVVRPGNIEMTRPDQSVLDTITAAGGFTDHSIPAEVVVLRGNGAATRRLPVDVAYILKTGDMSGNLKVEPGDRVQVPRSNIPTWHEVWQATQGTVAIIGLGTTIILLWDRVFPPETR